MSNIARDLTNKVVVVTGASRGIGAATARTLASYGASLVLLGRNREQLKAVENTIKFEFDNARALTLPCDVADSIQMADAIARANTHFGHIDVLINNAGILEPIKRILDLSPQEWQKVINVNTIGVYNGIHAVLPIMLAQGGGTILNMSSGSATRPIEAWSHYCASKAAVKMLTQCLHLEYADQGIITVGLSPGTVATDMMRSIKDSGINRISQMQWSDHIPPEWAAEAFAYLCTDAAKHYAGTDFTIKTEEGRQAVGLT